MHTNKTFTLLKPIFSRETENHKNAEFTEIFLKNPLAPLMAIELVFRYDLVKTHLNAYYGGRGMLSCGEALQDCCWPLFS
jgi:hypothetical protein